MNKSEMKKIAIEHLKALNIYRPYIADVCDARKIYTLRDFNTTEEVLQWLRTYLDIYREEIDIKC